MLAEGYKSRVTAVTAINAESSRSHAMVCIEVTGNNLITGSKTFGKTEVAYLPQ